MGYDQSEPLTVGEFEEALRKGLGRTVLCVRRFGDANYSGAILNGCFHDLRFDRQVVEEYGQYLTDIIGSTGNQEWYLERLIAALPDMNPDDSDPWQVVSILRRFAVAGHTGARAAVLAAFDRSAERGSLEYLDDLLLIEGSNGLERAAHRIPWDSIPEDDRWWVSGAVDDLAHRDGDEPTRAAIRSLMSTAPILRPWFAYLEDDWHRSDKALAQPPASRPVQAYEEFVAMLDSRVARGRDSVLSYLFLPMRRCTQETVDRLAHDLLDETDPLRRLGLLRAFRHRPFPFGHRPLMPFVESADEDERFWATRALAQLTHDEIRGVALRGAASDMRPDLVAELLERNVRPGDEHILLELCRRDLEANIYHWMGMHLRDLLEADPGIEPRDIGCELYERGPCSMCRHSVVEILLNARQLPDWMLAEFPYDAYSETRKLIQATNQPSGTV